MKSRFLEIALDRENRKWWTLLAVSFGLFMIMLDNTVVNVALPSIASSSRSRSFLSQLRSPTGEV